MKRRGNDGNGCVAKGTKYSMTEYDGKSLTNLSLEATHTKMTISDITGYLEAIAPPALQESYDNAGLITGLPGWPCTGAIISLDATEAVVDEAIRKNCNLVISHHPIVFGGLKKINGKNYVEQAVIKAIKNDIALYAIHTNLDNILQGVNGRIADKLELTNRKILFPKSSSLKKLFSFVPVEHADKVLNALFEAGGGNIGNYGECSYRVEGTGTFTAGEGTDPFVGEKGKRHHEKEAKIEVIFPSYLEATMVKALKVSHPYEEVAYDLVSLSNAHPGLGAGIVGELPRSMDESSFLGHVKERFGLKLIRHTRLNGREVKTVALCGGAGSFLISSALAAGADFYITADLKYHEFFDANNRMVLADIGHYESEQFTIDLLHEILQQKFPTFASLKTEVNTNPVLYFQ